MDRFPVVALSRSEDIQTIFKAARFILQSDSLESQQAVHQSSFQQTISQNSGRPADASSSSIPQVLHVHSTHSTLTEPVSATIKRDLWRIYHNLLQVLLPHQHNEQRSLRDWDLWGPFFFVFWLSITLSIRAEANKSAVFAIVFAVLSSGAVSLTVNAVLLGGRLNFFQSLSMVGYCLFPLDIGAIICVFIRNKILKSIIVFATLSWSSWAVYPYVSTAVPPSRKILAIYPVFLMFVALGLLILANG